MARFLFVSLALAGVATIAFNSRAGAAGDEKIQLTISGGHETDPRDRGRPVALVAGGLKVAPEVFREAFSRVQPAAGGAEPEPAQVRRNKEVLMAALAKHGVTNDELDRVSNYYRIPPGRGKLWPVEAATGHAVFKDGVFKSIVIANPGSGYNSLPTVSIPGHPEIALEVKLAYGSDLKKNGSIASVAQAKGHEKAASGPGRLLSPNTKKDLNLTKGRKRKLSSSNRNSTNAWRRF